MKTPEVLKLRGALLAKGYTIARLARELGVSHATVSKVIHRTGRSARVAKRIAEIIGKEWTT